MNQLNMKKKTKNCEMSPSFDFYIQSINTYTNRTTCTFTEAREFMEKNLAFTKTLFHLRYSKHFIYFLK